MTEGSDLIVGAVLMDNLFFADGTARENVAGGAGLYALAGAALFSNDPVLVTGTGRDLPDTFGPWLARNGLSKRGLRFADDHAPRNLLRYFADNSRTETPVFGFEHFSRIEPAPGDIARVLPGARAAYIFRNTDPIFWSGVQAQLRALPIRVLWEIGLDACSPAERPRIEAICAGVDGFSLNREEAALIFETTSEDRLVEHLQALGAPQVFLRLGARGSLAITRSQAVFVPSLPGRPVDVTGGGNSYSGAALVGIANNRDAVTCAAMGTVAASLAIAQYGPFEPRDPAVRQWARDQLADLLTGIGEPAQ